MTICAQEKAAGRAATAARTRQAQPYHARPRKSRLSPKIIPGKPDRRPPQPPANGIDQGRREWLSRAGDVLSAFVVNLDSQHLAQGERREGWRVFEDLLSAYVDRKHGLSRGAAA